jgi:8-oxo-dGTP pyrophosphatase MutT (NUDIX family)
MSAPGTHEFRVVHSSDAYVGKVLALRVDDVAMPGGGTGRREIMEHPGAVAVVALDPDDRLMMIYQYRHAVGRRLWEIPAGLLDVHGEDPAVTARRELAEEVGLAAADWSVLVDSTPSPGFSDESVRIYLASGLSDVDRPDPADDEEADLELHWVPLAEAVRQVLAGEIVNSSTCAGVLAAYAVRAGAAEPRPVDAPWPDRPTRFAARQD